MALQQALEDYTSGKGFKWLSDEMLESKEAFEAAIIRLEKTQTTLLKGFTWSEQVRFKAPLSPLLPIQIKRYEKEIRDLK